MSTANGCLESSQYPGVASFLDFGPYSPFAGTGSLFLPNLPWLNPGALALGIPAPIEYKHLFSYFVYLAELTLSMYLFILGAGARTTVFVHRCLIVHFIFFHTFQFGDRSAELVQFGSIFCHQAAAMNLATVALLRCGPSTFRASLLWGLVFIPVYSAPLRPLPCSIWSLFRSMPRSGLYWHFRRKLTDARCLFKSV